MNKRIRKKKLKQSMKRAEKNIPIILLDETLSLFQEPLVIGAFGSGKVRRYITPTVTILAPPKPIKEEN